MAISSLVIYASLLISVIFTLVLLKWRTGFTIQAFFILWIMTGLLYILNYVGVSVAVV